MFKYRKLWFFLSVEVEIGCSIGWVIGGEGRGGGGEGRGWGGVIWRRWGWWGGIWG